MGVRCSVAVLAIICALLQLLFQCSSASYSLRVRAERYWNSRHKGSDGRCCDRSTSSNCDPSWCSYCQCDNRFKFCLRRHGASRDGDEGDCPLGSFSTGDVGDDSFTFGLTQIDSGIPNPMRFQGDIWRGGFQILVSIYDDDDTSANDHVDDVYLEELMEPGDTITEREYIGRRSNAHIVATITLSCNNNFYGSDCTTFCRPRNNAQGHYTCDQTTGAKICRTGWADPNSNCLTPVCAEGCNMVGGYCDSPGACTCLSGWSGSTCLECQLSPGCSEVGGYCNVPNECICSEGYSGMNCEIDLIPCQRGSPCSNDALCTNDGLGGYICHCPPGYSGMECDQEINECDPNPCYNGSTCIDEVGGYYCMCPDGYKGELCHVDIDECLSGPCKNNGTCVDITNGYVCLCTDGYEGDVCEHDHDDCIPYPCENGGNCTDLLGGFMCECAVGWTGDRCQVDIDDCLSFPCLNGGSCYDRVDGYECVCETGWEGHSCHQEVDECVSSPCQNGAQCTDLFASYNCTCMAGYFGPRCEYEFNECLSGPCFNGGECLDLVNGYSCNCTSDFSGANCELNLNPCRDDPCQNGGTCVGEAGGGYACHCSPGYTDYNCVSEIDPMVEGLSSDENDDEVKGYMVWAIPSAGVLILILIVAVAIVYARRRRKRIPILPPPSEPMGNGMGTGGKGMEKESSAVANPVYGGTDLASPEPHVYETLDTYAVPSDLPLEGTKPPLKDPPYETPDTAMMSAVENPYSNTDY